MGDGILMVDGLWKRYGRVEALKGLEFSVPRGAFFGLLGRNGAGKTTTLDIVTGLLARDRGRVQILGEELGAELSPEAKERLAYVLERMQDDGVITPAQKDEALAAPPKLVAYEHPRRDTGFHFVDFLGREAKSDGVSSLTARSGQPSREHPLRGVHHRAGR